MKRVNNPSCLASNLSTAHSGIGMKQFHFLIRSDNCVLTINDTYFIGLPLTGSFGHLNSQVDVMRPGILMFHGLLHSLAGHHQIEFIHRRTNITADNRQQFVGQQVEKRTRLKYVNGDNSKNQTILLNRLESNNKHYRKNIIHTVSSS